MQYLALPSGAELWIVALIVLVFFGGRKLPELARAAGSSITQFKKGLKEGEDALEETKEEVQKD